MALPFNPLIPEQIHTIGVLVTDAVISAIGIQLSEHTLCKTVLRINSEHFRTQNSRNLRYQ